MERDGWIKPKQRTVQTVFRKPSWTGRSVAMTASSGTGVKKRDQQITAFLSARGSQEDANSAVVAPTDDCKSVADTRLPDNMPVEEYASSEGLEARARALLAFQHRSLDKR